MGVEIPVGYGQATVRWRYVGSTRDAVTTFGYDPGTLDPATHAFDIHTALTAANRPCVNTNMCVGWVYLGVRTTEQDESGPLSSEFAANVVGTKAGGPLTPNVAVLIRKVTNSGGRKNRGRMFIPPLSPAETAIDATGVINASDVTDLSTWWNGVRTALSTALLPMVILHGSEPFTPTPVVSLVVDNRVATQRRRLRK